jgi:hypothetical protein
MPQIRIAQVFAEYPQILIAQYLLPARQVPLD